MRETEKELIRYSNSQANLVRGGTNAIEDTLYPILELYNRGVKIKILIGGISNQTQLKPILRMIKKLDDVPQIPVRYISVTTNSFDVIDGEKVLLKITSPVNPTEYFAAIYIWQKKFAVELKKKFNQMWNEAKSFSLN
jgi:hypothetical protein